MPGDALRAFESERVKVVIVDDHEAIRLGFKGACAEYGFDLLASADTVDGVLEGLDPTCQVAVLDLSLADGSVVADNVQKLVKFGLAVLIFSQSTHPRVLQSALQAGAMGLVPKSETLKELANAVRLVANGVIVNNTQTTAAIDADHDFKVAKLSTREREVLSLYASGLSLKQVAYNLGIAQGTAKDYIDRVRTKYADIGRPAANKTELILRAIEDGLFSIAGSEDLI